ncbi:caspase domain-containing protein [Scytonema sp. NUACC26]|uniref:caspase family protein n=1 Tax=Scytonema sp. NUACC26 TaxID=3140176 RepID=UPI0034DCC37E
MTEQITQTSEAEFRQAHVVISELESVHKGRSIIVTIGIDKYEHWSQLRNAVNDAIGIQQILVDKLGFIVPISPLTDSHATKDAILNIVEGQLHEVLQEDDNLLLFFAGHGHTRVDKIGGEVRGETSFIVPVKARKPDSKEYWQDYIEVDSFLKAISKLPARHILVVLDSCHSGLALGEAMKTFRDTVRYEKDLSRRISRKVITSARREQPALDGGSISGHSLFTGTIIDGFNWGKADLDGNGIITSSELGLFVQQKVGQASESKQTPDFGSFHLDDRGEMVISLRNQSFDALKARAFSILQNGEFTVFREIVEQVVSLRPSSPEALYLEDRLRFFENNIERVIEIINILSKLNFSEGTIPLSNNDLWNLEQQLPCWKTALSIPNREFPLDVTFLTGDSEKNLTLAHEQNVGEKTGYFVEYDSIMQFSIKNTTKAQAHIYMVEISSEGRLTPVPLWQDEDVMWNGLAPGETRPSYPFYQNGAIGICELRLFYSPKRLRFFLFPPSAAGRGVIFESIDVSDLEIIKMKAIHYSMRKSLL